MRFKTFLILTLCFVAYINDTHAVEGRPKLRRACLDNIDSLLDLLWFKPTDNCNSFVGFNLYGRDNALDIFRFLGTYNNPNQQNLSIKLPNVKKSWEFYLVYSKACNGIDSIYSDTINIDQTPPADTELDSVSVDLATQKVRIGWQRNPSPDVKGYYVYYVTSTNSIITTTTGTGYIDNSSRDPGTDTMCYSFSTFDSCNNTNVISHGHTTIFLKTAYDQCAQTIKLNWTPYRGWDVGIYQVFLKIDSGPYKLIITAAPSVSPSFTYNFSNYGSTYCFYVRAIKSGSPISSSSNAVCVNASGIVKARNSYIAKASVQNGVVELTLITQTGASIKKVNIYKAESNGPFGLWQTVNTGGGIINLIDQNVNVQSKTYSYFFNTEGPCPNTYYDSSQIAKTILLSVVMQSPGDQNINWSLYKDFIKLTSKQELLLSNTDKFNRGSPWNILSTLNNSAKFSADNTNFGINQEQICYCVRAIENSPNAQFPRQDTSYSNIQCVTADPIVFFPNAIQLNGFNTIFYPKGVFIDYDKSSFAIYNRWGQIIFETNHIQNGWDGKSGDRIVESDVYMYKARIVGINGAVLYFDGTITVLK